jgi:hypothetical protein
VNSIGRLLASLQDLGVKPSLETFAERKRNQKLAYLIQEVAGVPLGYSFSWYVRGPYSPSLTQDLYAESSTQSLPVGLLQAGEKLKLLQLRDFLGDYLKSPDELELLVSLHYLRERGKEYGATKLEVTSALKERKPFFSNQVIEQAWLKLEELENY